MPRHRSISIADQYEPNSTVQRPRGWDGPGLIVICIRRAKIVEREPGERTRLSE
jgi:hypothetical protein